MARDCRQRGKSDPAARRDALIKAETARLAADVRGPVIAAGSTGSMPATAELIARVANLPHGALVLPGLDTDLDDHSWGLISGTHDSGDERKGPACGHPQFALQGLLRRIGIAREEVIPLAQPSAHRRERLLSEALRPAAATDRWQQLAGTDGTQIESALASLAIIEAGNPEEEALAIAIALRETLEITGKTAALVTPDRGLARRVLAALGRWRIAVDDSGGDALADTPAGLFARIAAETVLGGCPPVHVLALLKHPLARLGATAGAQARAVAALEKAVLRGPRPRPGTAGLLGAITTLRTQLGKLRRGEPSDLHRSDPRADLSDREIAAASDLAVQLTSAVLPLEGVRISPFAEIAAHHRTVVAALSADQTGAAAAFLGPDGAALDLAFEEIARHEADANFAVAPADYPELFRATIADRVVRRAGRPGVRVRVYGLLEARLQHVDRIVLGGLVEGIWPPQPGSDPWLSRPMRHALGLDLPERQISLSAHDFAQALGAEEVILSYPAKLAGTPTVTSRFVQRLAAVAGEQRWAAVRQRGDQYLRWARVLDRPSDLQRIKRPTPRPPRAARPLALSVTDIENWLRDPYTIYAKHVLKLRELDCVDLAPGAADRGIVIHGALCEFTRTFADALPTDTEDALLAIGQKHFATLEDYPEARAFWWPRFRRIARWFVSWEAERRAQVSALAADFRPHPHLAWRAYLYPHRARRPHRAAERWPLRHSRLQDRTGAERKAGTPRHFAAAHAGSRHPARRRLRQYRGGSLRRRARVRVAQRR